MEKEFHSLAMKVESANDKIAQLERKISIMSHPIPTKCTDESEPDDLEKENL